MRINKGDLIKVVYWAHTILDSEAICIINMNTGRMQVLDLESDRDWSEETHLWAESIDSTLKTFTNGTAILDSYYA